LIGADLTETHPIAKNEIIMATGRKRARVIVIDSIKTKLTERDGIFLKAPVGSESIVVFSMIKTIMDEGLFDKASIGNKAEGLEALLESLADYTPENVASKLGIDANAIREAARIFAQAPTAMILLSEGLYRDSSGVENARAAADLAVITGHIGKESCGIMALGEKANSQGAVDMGLTPQLLPGFALLEDEASRKKFDSLWKTKLPATAGLNAREILAGAETGAIKALYVVAENPVDDYPDRLQVEKAFKEAEFVVVQDIFFSSTAKLADVVLPACSALEKNGTFTSAERRVQTLRPSTKEKLGKSDLELFELLAKRMGSAQFTYSSPEAVMAEISKCCDVYAGVSYDGLGANGIIWPCKDSGDSGASILCQGGFPTGKAKLAPAGPLNAPVAKDGQFVLVQGVSKFHSGSMSMWSSSLIQVCPEPLAEMCTADMNTLGVEEGNTIRLTSETGESVRLKVKWSRRSLPGEIIVPCHFPSLKLNSLVKWNEPLVKVKVEKA